MTTDTNFNGLGLPTELLEGLRRKGFKHPTAIQALVIPEVEKGGDLIVQAQTGSGKTLAFGLPLLARAPVDERAPSAIIVAPTRELAKQIRTELTSVCGTLKRRVVLACGGESLDRQIDQLKKGADVVVGTPGRLLELLQRNVLNLKQIKTLVLDEADEMLVKGFAEDLTTLSARMSTRNQTLLFSATMPAAVQRLADDVLAKPRRLKVPEASIPTEIDHFMIEVEDETRLDTLAAWLLAERPFMALVFCRTRTETEWLSDELAKRGFVNEYLSGELSQAKRSRLLETFRSGDLPLLIATDLAARGLDVPGITHVVNYGVPTTMETYIHRTGRTGRAGRKGVALSLVAPFERRKLQEIAKLVTVTKWRRLPLALQRGLRAAHKAGGRPTRSRSTGISRPMATPSAAPSAAPSAPLSVTPSPTPKTPTRTTASTAAKPAPKAAAKAPSKAKAAPKSAARTPAKATPKATSKATSRTTTKTKTTSRTTSKSGPRQGGKPAPSDNRGKNPRRS